MLFFLKEKCIKKLETELRKIFEISEKMKKDSCRVEDIQGRFMHVGSKKNDFCKEQQQHDCQIGYLKDTFPFSKCSVQQFEKGQGDVWGLSIATEGRAVG